MVVIVSDSFFDKSFNKTHQFTKITPTDVKTTLPAEIRKVIPEPAVFFCISQRNVLQFASKLVKVSDL